MVHIEVLEFNQKKGAEMAGYLIAELNVTDQELFAEFATKIVELVKDYDGRYLVRGGDTEVIEGDWDPQRVVVIEFDSYARVQEVVRSAEYKELAEIRSKSSTSSTIIVDGV